MRSEEHTRLFLAGLASRGVRLRVERVDSAWVARAVGPAAAGGGELHGAAAPAPATPAPTTPAAATPPGSDMGPDMGSEAQWPRGAGAGGVDGPGQGVGVPVDDEAPPLEMAAVREGAVLFVRGEFT